MWPFGDFVAAISAPLPPGQTAVERIHSVGQQVQGGAPFVDDFSILEIQFV